ncbi:hypothetical protein L228DRAFT_266514 [Xylona heveae TC161]|uniref:Zn(2)-C6 fungal-type domain-containing protein n=1 Tax=Xylona heveae (strain CBS 132557 / TC161) TaxID=1328760 RepID=A0A165HZW0_XYLHT|nr:hypothetical protein L228DRAFT_266514 [Xylona heveae TC161]KZF24154.1 hypothetical protein L228DRAFT_266514 [Xylona heveae TC161]
MEPGLDSSYSSPDQAEDDPNGTGNGLWSHQQALDGGEGNSTSPDDSAQSPGQAALAPKPTQKRRRVTRACDECRRKKIKCDGKQPCTHCTVYSYDCTYDQPSNRRRNPAPQYIEAIEQRLHRAETILKAVMPDLDLGSVDLDQVISQKLAAARAPEQNTQSKQTNGVELSRQRSNVGQDGAQDPLLESMVENTGQLDLDDDGKWDYHGHSSGLAFISKLRRQFGDQLLPSATLGPWEHYRPFTGSLYDSPRSADSPMESGIPNVAELPPRETAMQLCANALDDACALMRLVHQPSFYEMVDRIYSTPPENFANAENRFLPLLYVILALGCLFAKTEQSALDREGYEIAIDHGFKYFKAGRTMIDITDCRDITSLQAVVVMVMFLQASARLSTCYSYVGIALRSCLSMGLHRSLPMRFNPIEREVRKRVFWIVRKMDTYVSASLGLPKSLNDEDIDQEMPMEVEDDYITRDGILPTPEGHFSLISANNAHGKLVAILAKVIKYIYPLKSAQCDEAEHSSQTYLISHAKIREIERDLQDWMERLPVQLRPGGEVTADLSRAQQLLRMAYAHVQMMLYRPFLHYVSQSSQTKSVDKRSFACAAACVSVSRNIIHITAEMKKRGLLIGAYWFTMYTTFFAILSLLFFVLQNPDSLTSQDLLRDAIEGRETLASLSNRSMAADRCSKSLTLIFERLPEKVKIGRTVSQSSSRKRSAAAANGPEASAKANLPTRPTSIALPNQILQRATTFPTQMKLPSKTNSAPNSPENGLLQGLNDASTTFRSNVSDGYSPTNSGNLSNTPSSSFSIAPQQITQTNPLTAAGVPDLSAMMFPSADPFAYPNQPMTTLENFRQSQEPFSLFQSPTPSNGLFMLNGNSSNPYDNLEVPLFGPLPPYPYLVPDQHLDTALATQPDSGNVMMPVMDDPQEAQGRPAITPGLDLDKIFGGDDWNGIFMDQKYQALS